MLSLGSPRYKGGDPFPPEDLTGRVNDTPDNGYQVPAAVYLDFGDGVAVLVIDVDDPFDLTLELGDVREWYLLLNIPWSRRAGL